MELDKIIIKYGADLAELKADMAELKKTTTGFEQSATTSAKKVEESLNSVGSTVNTKLSTAFKNLAGTIAAAFAVERIGAFISSSIQLAAEAQEVRAEFEKLNNPLLLSNLRKATGGTLSDLKLMGIALRADKLQIPLEKLTKILEFAKLRGDALGKSTEELAESLIQGIGIKGTRALVQVGISQEQFSAEVKKTGDYFTALDNIMTETLDNAGDGFESVADKQEKLRANIENTKVEIGNGLLPALSKALDLTNAWVKGMSLIPKYFKLLFDMDGDFQRLIINNKKAKEEFEKYTEAVSKFTSDEDINAFTRSFTDQLKNQSEVIRENMRNADATSKVVMQDQIDSISRLIQIINDYRDTLTEKTEATVEDNVVVEEATEQVWGLGAALLFMAKHAQDAQVSFGDHLVGGIGRAREAIGTARTEAEKFRDGIEVIPETTSDALDKSEDMWDEYAGEIMGLAASMGNFFERIEDNRLAHLQDRLEKGLISQQQYDRAEKEILIDKAKRDRLLAIFDIILNTARGISAAIPNPFLVALATATGGVQLATAVNTNIPAFKTGVIDFKGDGTATSDSNLVRISHGESVITAKATRKHKDLLDAINKDKFDQYMTNVYLKKKVSEEDDYRNYMALKELGYINKNGFNRLIETVNRQKERRF